MFFSLSLSNLKLGRYLVPTLNLRFFFSRYHGTFEKQILGIILIHTTVYILSQVGRYINFDQGLQVIPIMSYVKKIYLSLFSPHLLILLFNQCPVNCVFSRNTGSSNSSSYSTHIKPNFWSERKFSHK